MKAKSLSRVRLFVTPWTVAHQAPPSMEFSRQEEKPDKGRGGSQAGKGWALVEEGRKGRRKELYTEGRPTCPLQGPEFAWPGPQKNPA